jgi:hypothetical protein
MWTPERIEHPDRQVIPPSLAIQKAKGIPQLLNPLDWYILPALVCIQRSSRSTFLLAAPIINPPCFVERNSILTTDSLKCLRNLFNEFRSISLCKHIEGSPVWYSLIFSGWATNLIAPLRVTRTAFKKSTLGCPQA